MQPALRRALTCACVTLASACVDSGPSSNARVSVAVAPLSLPGVSDACYGLTVYDRAGGAGQVVWSEFGICAHQYGNSGGDISYIGTCVDENADGPTLASVALVVEGLCAGGPCAPGVRGTIANGLAADSYVNPCPADRPCILDVACEANRDTPVTFDLTIMRDAQQGFFDIAVNFADVFCSAKFDCVDAEGAPLALLSDASRDRRRTAVLALACTAGPQAAGATDATEVLMDDLVVSCSDGFTQTIDVTAGPGNLMSPPLDADDAEVFQAAVYEGREQLTCPGPNGTELDCQKAYWNVAVGLGEGLAGHGDCAIAGAFTAGSGFDNGFTPPGAYPVVVLAVDLTDDGALVCTRHALDAAGDDGLATIYTNIASDGAPFGNIGHMLAGDFSTDGVSVVDHDGVVAGALPLTLGDHGRGQVHGALGADINPKVPGSTDLADVYQIDAGPAGTELSLILDTPCCESAKFPAGCWGSCDDRTPNPSLAPSVSLDGGASFVPLDGQGVTSVISAGLPVFVRMGAGAPVAAAAYDVGACSGDCDDIESTARQNGETRCYCDVMLPDNDGCTGGDKSSCISAGNGCKWVCVTHVTIVHSGQ